MVPYIHYNVATSLQGILAVETKFRLDLLPHCSADTPPPSPLTSFVFSLSECFQVIAIPRIILVDCKLYE